ncbi:glycerophosphodiester phosphodiesterase [Candidatus Leptofilum sp.]|uniref:glycerophosphodiester phosphodiesterase n=1 Tax=Candidatus Leptofilum sp. TaxID=3241576 RepID=UPI003B5BF325
MPDWSSGKRPFIIGHRGASAEAPENTLAAFVLAQAQGADGIELDVQLSADGWPVVIHDGKLDRTTDGRGRVQDFAVAELQTFDAGQGQPVPTLDEVFVTLGPNFLYNVELKTAAWRDTGLATAVAERIEAHNMARQTVVSSFNPLAVRYARRHLTHSTWVAHLSYKSGFKFKHSLIPVQAVHPYYKMVNANYMAWAQQNGWGVNVWTVDDPTEAQRLAELGVHGIITNKPKLIREALFGHES